MLNVSSSARLSLSGRAGSDSTNSQIIGKPKDEDEIGEELKFAIIEKNYLIKTGFTDIQNQRRFWEIEGFSKVACGGTHVKKTSEVGYIALKRINVGGGKERIEIKLIENNLGLN